MPELSKDANLEGKKPATTGDISKIAFNILDMTKELNIIISEVNSELIGSSIEVQEEKDVAKKASEGWIEDEYKTLFEAKKQITRAVEKVQLLKSRLRGEK